MSAEGIPADIDASPGRRLGRSLEAVAFALLLASLAARCFLGEMTFRGSALRAAMFLASGDGAQTSVHTDELSRLHFALILLSAVALWTIGQAARGAIRVRFAHLGWLICLFAAISLASAIRASDKRAALTGWLEQVSLLSAGFVAIQLCAEKRRFAVVIVVLAALGGALAAKGLSQHFVEIPQRVEDFRMYRDQRLGEAGWAPTSPQGRLIAIRMMDRAPFGFFSLANLFASLLIVLLMVGAGLAVDKIALAAAGYRRWTQRRRTGELYTPALAAGLTALIVACVAIVLLLTRSCGAVAGAAAAVIAAVFVGLWARRLVRHWRKALLAAVVVATLGAGAVVAWGLKRSRLPTQTMTYRWYYWTGAAAAIRDNPALGVGPGNFHTAYLLHRRPEAEEEVKDPHNVVMAALSQYGLAGGLCYLTVLGAALVGLARPGKHEPPTDALTGQPRGTIAGEILMIVVAAVLLVATVHLIAAASSPVLGPAVALSIPLLALLGVVSSRFRRWAPLAAVVAAPLAARGAYGYPGGSTALLIVDVIVPVAVFGGMLVVMLWAGGGISSGLDAPGRFCRIALACGLGGFVLHNMVSYSLWAPGAALVFWVAVGACLGRAGGGPLRSYRRLRWPGASAAVAVLVVCAAVLVEPVIHRTKLIRRAIDSARVEPALAAQYAVSAARADTLDPIAAADAARALLFAAGRDPNDADLERASEWADSAMRRDPANYAYSRLAGWIAWDSHCPDFRKYPWRPVDGDPDIAAARLRGDLSRDPGDSVLLSQLAGVEYFRGRYAESLRLLDLATGKDADSPVLWAHLGDAAWRAGNGERAEGAWRRSVQLHRPGRRGAEAVNLMGRAVALNPQAARLRLDYARLLCWTGDYAEALEQLQAARTIDAALVPRSVERLGAAEADRLEMLEIRANCLISVPPAESPGR